MPPGAGTSRSSFPALVPAVSPPRPRLGQPSIRPTLASAMRVNGVMNSVHGIDLVHRSVGSEGEYFAGLAMRAYSRIRSRELLLVACGQPVVVDTHVHEQVRPSLSLEAVALFDPESATVHDGLTQSQACSQTLHDLDSDYLIVLFRPIEAPRLRSLDLELGSEVRCRPASCQARSQSVSAAGAGGP